MIINELLTYAKHYINCSTIDNVKRVIQLFYTNDEIIQAKRSLWDAVSPVLGNYPDRKSTDRRHVSVAHVGDILEALKKLDADDKLPDVAACNMDRLPDRQPEELNLLRIVQRVAELERSRDQHADALSTLSIDVLNMKENRQSYSGAVRSSANTSFTETTEISVPPNNSDAVDISNESSQPSAQSLGESNEGNANRHGDGGPRRGSAVRQGAPSRGHGRTAAGGREWNRRPSQHQHHRSSMSMHRGQSMQINNRGHAHQNQVDEDGFLMVRSRNKKRIVGSGNATSQGLQGAPPPLRLIWVSRVMGGDALSLDAHLQSHGINVVKVDKVSHVEAKFGSFKVSIYKNDVEKVMKDSVWPSGVRCEFWRERKTGNKPSSECRDGCDFLSSNTTREPDNVTDNGNAWGEADGRI